MSPVTHVPRTHTYTSTQVEDLARLSLKKPLYIGVDDQQAASTAARLEQGYCVVPSQSRLLLLYTFLKKNRNKKVMVFFSSCNSVKYHSELFNYIDLPVLDIHGKQKQQKRTSTFFEFCKADKGIMLCTDVAARGLDIPAVDWIIQYDPPDDPKEYIHRVGRTARGATGSGRGLLFLIPEELGFLKYLRVRAPACTHNWVSTHPPALTFVLRPHRTIEAPRHMLLSYHRRFLPVAVFPHRRLRRCP